MAARFGLTLASMLLAMPAPTNTSGDFAALSGTDGYVVLDRDVTEFAAGTIAAFVPWT